MFKRAMGLHYYRFLRRLHGRHLFDWYLEIGCRTGDSLALARCKTIGVDPFFRAAVNIIGTKPALHIAQQTSDEFFASGYLANNRIKLSASFLDGMHLFEFLLRDFINTEAQSTPDSVIMMHDCVPYDFEMTTRDLSNLPQRAWTGDVWKLIPILQSYRPDLTLTVMDCRPTGLVCVTGLSPGNTVLADNYDKIVKQYQDVTLEAFGVERFVDSFELTDALECARAGFPQWKAAGIDPGLAIQPQLVST